MSLELHQGVLGADQADMADLEPGVEEQVSVNMMLAGLLAVFDGLDPEVQVILALRYYCEMPFDQIAEAMFTTLESVTEMHTHGVIEVHQALLRLASTEDTGCRPVRVA